MDGGGSNVEGTEDAEGNDFSTEPVDNVPAAGCDDDSQATRAPSVSAIKNAANNRVVEPM